MPEPSLLLVRAFVTVVEHNSFARAASALAMTPSSVSRLVKKLEQELGMALLNRSTRAMSLTDAGQRYFSTCSGALSQLRDAYEMLRDERDVPHGTLVVSAPVAFGHSHVVPYVAGFLETFPNVRLDLRLGDGYVDLVAEGVMLALRIGRLDDSSLVARKMLSTRRILVASPAYLRRYGTPATCDDLRNHHCLVSTANRDGMVWRLFSGDTVHVFEPRRRFVGDNADAIRRLCIDSMGISFHSAVTLAVAIDAGQLVQVLPQWTGRESGVYYMRPQRRKGAAATAFIDYLSARWHARP